ncbi:hypothetical protein V8C86DRAFT_407171 [Haematococcus lacustris]
MTLAGRRTLAVAFLIALIMLLAPGYLAAAAPCGDWAAALADEGDPQFLDDLAQLVAFPSVSADPASVSAVRAAAEWLAQRLRAAGLDHVAVLETSGEHPVVFARHLLLPPGSGGEGPGARPGAAGRVLCPLCCCMATMMWQPVDPLEQWQSPPFTLTQRQGHLYGRGVDDDKGGLLQALHAVEALVRASRCEGPPPPARPPSLPAYPGPGHPLLIKLFFEGQEEIMSPHLSQFLEAERDLLAADLVMSADGGQPGEGQGGISLGLRGVVGMEVEVVTAATDMHSGMKGGSVANPNSVLARLLAGLHHTHTARVAVEGFYEGVAEPSEADEQDMEAFGWDEAREAQALGLLGSWGEAGYGTLARRWHRPSLDVVGMWGGFTGTGIKTVIPRSASAKISCRLVPGQEPDDIVRKVSAHLEAAAPPYCRISVRRLGGSSLAWHSPRDCVGNVVAARIHRQLSGKEPLYYRDGATIPALAAFQTQLNLSTTKFGWGLSEAIHAPNERLKLSQWHLGRLAWGHLLVALADDPELRQQAQARQQQSRKDNVEHHCPAAVTS